MSAPKTSRVEPSVGAYLETILDDSRRRDCLSLIDLMNGATGAPPRMWGKSMVGFGEFHYRYESGRQGETFLVGFASRKPGITLYLGYDMTPHEGALKRLGKHKIGKGCLHIRRLDDVDASVLSCLLAEAARINSARAG